MLPLTMLQPTELATFAPEPNTAELLPQDAIEPVVAFADILQVGLQLPVQTATDNGIPVPVTGNGLPPITTSETPAAGPGGDRVLPLPAVEPMTTDSRLITSPAETRILPPAAEGRLPAPPPMAPANAMPREALPRDASAPAPIQAPAAERLPDDALQQPAIRQETHVHRGAPGQERVASEPAARSQIPVDSTVQRTMPVETLAANAAIARPDRAETDHGRARRPAPTAEGLAAIRGNPDTRPAPPSRHGVPQPGIAPEIRQPATVAPAGQPAPIPVDGVSQGDTPFPQAPGSTQGVQLNPAQLSPAPTQPTSTGTGAAAAQAQAPIDIPVRDTAWSGALGERVLVMANNQLQNAEIRLTPAELGPLRVQVAVEDGAANVTFHAQHAITREAIEQALPRLRELFAENGLTLNQADVGEQGGPGVRQGNREAAGDGGSADGTVAQIDADPVAEGDVPPERPRSRPDGLVDTFA